MLLRASIYFRSISGGATCAIGRLSLFFFSSRRRHTRLQGDWSSDVCSSDLTAKMYGAFGSAREAYGALKNVKWPAVIKADGLCAGKGVLVAQDFNEAHDFLERVMERNELGTGGKRVLLEEGLEGDELSFIVVTDGRSYAPLVPTRDHKRVFDGNQGPNTGGVGAGSA